MRFAETLLMNVAVGLQPTFVAVASAVIVGVGVAKTTNVSAPLLFIERICCVTVGFVASGPVSGWLSDKYGTRLFAGTGLLIVAATFIGLLLLPVDFSYAPFAILTFLNGVGSGMFASPNTAQIMNAVPAEDRGAAAGMRGTFFNAGSSLSIGVFFSLMIIGLASTLPTTLTGGLQAHGVPAATAQQIGQLPPVGSLFAAFLGYNPVAELLGPTGALQQLPRQQATTLTGTTFFPQLISGPFHDGLVVVFVAATVMMLIGAMASFATGREDKVA